MTDGPIPVDIPGGPRHPLIDQVVFDGPCYLIYAIQTRFSQAKVTLFNNGVASTVEISPHAFTRVTGTCRQVSIAPEAGQFKDYPANSRVTVGPNAWGILQPNDGGQHGVELAMTQNGKDINATFINPDPQKFHGPGPVIVPTNGPIPLFPVVTISNGSVNNGLTDECLLNVTYRSADVPPQMTPPVPIGQQTGPLLTAEIIDFQIRSTDSPVTWFPVGRVTMEPGMSLVVIGDSSAPSLAIMVPVGPVEIMALTTDIPE